MGFDCVGQFQFAGFVVDAAREGDGLGQGGVVVAELHVDGQGAQRDCSPEHGFDVRGTSQAGHGQIA